MDLWMYVLLGVSGILVIGSVYLHDKPDVQAKLKKAAGGGKSKDGKLSEIDEAELAAMRDTAEDFLEFDTIHKGMISFTKEPDYFTMAFGVHGVNISMYSAEERLLLKNGFMSILNTLKDDTQFLVQSRYVDLAKNFDYYKPVIKAAEKEREYLIERISIEKSEPIKRKMAEKAEKLKQRNNYADHIIDFFNFYTQHSDCIYIKIFVVVNYKHVMTRKQSRDKVIEEAYNTLSNKVKILREHFESMKLKTYDLDSTQSANIIYSTLLKNESSYAKLEDAVKSGLLDLAVETIPGAKIEDDEYSKYKDDYDYPYYDEAAAGREN